MEKKKILILTGSYGKGHNTAAENLKSFYETKGYEVLVIDILDHINSYFAKITKNLYERYPVVWKRFFNSTDSLFIPKTIYGFNKSIGQKKFDKIVDDFGPIKIISVFPMWNWWVKNYIKHNGSKIDWSVCITDSINIQSFWYIEPQYVKNIFVIDNFTKNELIKKFEYPEDKIIVSFFPILKENFKSKNHINNKNILILLTGLNRDLIIELLEELKGYNVKIIKGREDNIYNELKNIFYNSFHFFEYIDIISELKNTDIMIGKSGGAITNECISTDTPMIIPTFFPGQENGNKILLQKSHIGIYENNPQKISFLIKYLDWNKLLTNFNKVKKENSIEIIYNNA